MAQHSQVTFIHSSIGSVKGETALWWWGFYTHTLLPTMEYEANETAASWMVDLQIRQSQQ